MEAAARFQLPEAGVRTLAWTAGEARTRLPALWARAWEGFADVADVEYAVKLLLRFGDDTAAVAAFDEYLAQVVMTASPRSFRSKARAAARKLVPGDPAADHARALAERRVIHEKAADGMSWLHIHMSTVDATAVFRRATSTAKHLSRTLRDGRTRDQLRADLLAGCCSRRGASPA